MGLFDEAKSLNFSLYGQCSVQQAPDLMAFLPILKTAGSVPLFTWRKHSDIVKYNIRHLILHAFRFAVVMFLSNLLNVGPLIACGVSLLLAAICYGFAAFKGQAFASSKILGGTGVDGVV
ncbi:hypothetical protein [Parasitella parasitica]|uniref:Uncharacterized protein n=1 Tax=Parasitella parasitica TaxID=35722 RepID=A0A0B7MZV3_9FUNG|nr:hypothetical protein [Parasitella parasitica]